MGRLREIYAALKTIDRKSIESDILDIMKDHEPELVDLNTSQLIEGKDSEGNHIDPDYSPYTIEKKRREGKPTDRVQLLDEGDFHKGFFLKADKFPIRFTSSDSKTSKITRRYGKEIFGLTKQNLSDFNKDYLKEAIQRYFRTLLQL